MSAETWITNCEECNTPIDRLDQEKGIYFVGSGQSVCSEKCKHNEDSDLYYWTYYEEKETS